MAFYPGTNVWGKTSLAARNSVVENIRQGSYTRSVILVSAEGLQITIGVDFNPITNLEDTQIHFPEQLKPTHQDVKKTKILEYTKMLLQTPFTLSPLRKT